LNPATLAAAVFPAGFERPFSVLPRNNAPLCVSAAIHNAAS